MDFNKYNPPNRSESGRERRTALYKSDHHHQQQPRQQQPKHVSQEHLIVFYYRSQREQDARQEDLIGLGKKTR